MMFDIDILRIISNNIKPKVGKILISEPLLMDSIFSRSVIFLVDDLNDSHMGFVLNKKSEMKVDDAIEGFDKSDLDLFIGGPVDKDVVHFFHNFKNLSGATKINDNLYLDGNIDEMKILANTGVANKFNTKFFIGYSGWTKGQLNKEINDNAWLVANSNPKIVFQNENKLWNTSLDLVDKRYQIWKNFPTAPDLN